MGAHPVAALAGSLRRVPGLLKHILAAVLAFGTGHSFQAGLLAANVVLLSIGERWLGWLLALPARWGHCGKKWVGARDRTRA